MSALFLITGSSSGIGEAIARSLHGQGHFVCLTGRNEQRLKRITKELQGSTSFVCDLTQPSSIENLARHIESLDVPLKGLVNNAGIFLRQSINDTAESDWRAQFELNFFAAVNLTRRLFECLSAASPSSVLNISSTLGIRTVADTSAYSAAKAAMVSWTRSLALEWAKYQIRANCICPGLVDTPIHAFHGRSDADPIRIDAHAAQPLKRMGRPEDVAEAAAFLLSDKSSWTTGAVLQVDGGIALS